MKIFLAAHKRMKGNKISFGYKGPCTYEDGKWVLADSGKPVSFMVVKDMKPVNAINAYMKTGFRARLSKKYLPNIRERNYVEEEAFKKILEIVEIAIAMLNDSVVEVTPQGLKYINAKEN